MTDIQTGNNNHQNQDIKHFSQPKKKKNPTPVTTQILITTSNHINQFACSESHINV